MNIIWIDGGLGNQMFQYALALKMQSLGTQVKIDVTKYKDHHAHQGFELERVFSMHCPLADKAEICKLGYVKANHLTEWIKQTPFCKKTIYNNESYTYDKQVLKLDGYYIEGYWQSEQYFWDIRDKIREVYQFPDFLTTQQQAVADEIKGCCSVSVHVRRGDYLNYPYLQNICTIKYYQRAMTYFREKYAGQVQFYLFSNDFPWVKEHLQGVDCHMVEGNTGEESFRDMQLMSLCKHHIVANSSFSWWGAWLNGDPEKEVVAPERWVNHMAKEEVDIIPESWIKIGGGQDAGRFRI